MHKYKTVVTDYEGMQGVLDAHSAQGWRLFSADAGHLAQVGRSATRGMEQPPFEELDAHEQQGTQEYSASYYLLVFARDDTEDARPPRPPRRPLPQPPAGFWSKRPSRSGPLAPGKGNPGKRANRVRGISSRRPAPRCGDHPEGRAQGRLHVSRQVGAALRAEDEGAVEDGRPAVRALAGVIRRRVRERLGVG